MYTAEWSVLLLLILFLTFQESTSFNTITSNTLLKDGDTLVSTSQAFALGFFSPGDSNNRYVGVWFNRDPAQTVAWVANRNNPINDSSGALTISSDGNLVIYEKNQTVPIWSSGISSSATNNLTAQLLDTGNLVLVRNGDLSEPLWKSFDYPTDTLLPLMKIGYSNKVGLNWSLTSWKSNNDPGTGNYSYGVDPSGFPQLYLFNGSDIVWRSGSWSGKRWVGVPQMTSNFIFNISFVSNQDETYLKDNSFNSSVSSRMTLTDSGLVQRSAWSDQKHQWIQYYNAPIELCDFYGHCGFNSICNQNDTNQFECTCLPGFEPKSTHEWSLMNASTGCVRNSQLSMCHNGEGFRKVTRVKIPDTSTAHANLSLDLKACRKNCLQNCSCMAYASAYSDIGKEGSGCLMWYGNLIDTRTYLNAEQDLYVRVDAAELEKYGSPEKELGAIQLATILVSSILVLILGASLAYWLVKKCKGNRRSNHLLRLLTSYSDDSSLDKSKRNLDKTLFDLSIIATATDNFSINNKLGEGGFGPVYKGVLFNGKEIAIKRLSKYSGQGIEEFTNEISLIAKLQHRNLVRLLGCCIDKEEKMLIYEYLSNKSLDTFIFDEFKRSSLNWGKRFEIICGIARGISYLHQDSRLRIIHRDLKASNILLDDEMNPKISDFGMARIFGGNQYADQTNRVVGTYGYMAPEYAMEGRFSIKSDVYSFGVLLLEILVGRRNPDCYLDNAGSNLVGDVWALWADGKVMEIIDSTILEETTSATRCIQIGLLCVQEHATDRPNMLSVVSMLSTDIALPSPKQPAFVVKRGDKHGNSTTASETTNSVNEISITVMIGR